MTIEEFNKKYSLNFSETSYSRTAINTAARNVSITYSDGRLPTAEDEQVSVQGTPTQIAYIKHLKNNLKIFAKFRPNFGKNESLDGFISDYESMIAEMSPNKRKPYDGIPSGVFDLLKREAVANIPENSAAFERNFIEHNAKARKETETGYAKKRLADYIRKGKKTDAVDTLKAMESIHASHGWKFGNIFKNIREVFAIRSMRNSLKQAFGSEEEFERAYAKESEKFGYKEEEVSLLQIKNANKSPEAEQGEKGVQVQENFVRENVHVPEAEEPATTASERTQETQPVAPQKGLQ